MYKSLYKSSVGDIILLSDGISLTGLFVEGQELFAFHLDSENSFEDHPVLRKTREWLETYFSGRNPTFEIPVRFEGTDFQKEVWKILCSIPYGETLTYGEIAKRISEKRGIKRMSAQAVGRAVGDNKISIIVPCHRVVGKDGALVGYASGLDKKKALLELERGKMNGIS